MPRPRGKRPEKRLTPRADGRLIDANNIGRRGTKWRKAKQAMFRMWGLNCWWCGHPGAHWDPHKREWRGLEADHYPTPIRDGGDPYDPLNLRPSHGSHYPCYQCPRNRDGKPGKSCNQERDHHDQQPDTRPQHLDPGAI